MNWGYKIAIFYTAFAVFILALVVKSMNQEYDLVTEDYYGRELKFQEQIDKQASVLSNGKTVTWKIENNMLELTFAATGTIKGTIKLFRPSDASKDVDVELKPDSTGKQQIGLSGISKGKYLLQIDWNENGKAYFQESIIIL